MDEENPEDDGDGPSSVTPGSAERPKEARANERKIKENFLLGKATQKGLARVRRPVLLVWVDEFEVSFDWLQSEGYNESNRSRDVLALALFKHVSRLRTLK